MRQFSVSRIKQGDILGRTIYANDGRVLLGRGVVLTDAYIERLKALGISIIYVDDEETKDVIIEDVISEENRRKAMMTLEMSSQAVRVGKDLDGFEIKRAVNNIVEDVLFQNDIFINLVDIRNFDNQIFAHSVNVCVLSTVLGKALGFSRKDLEDLAVGALFHDIGTVKLPKELLHKREPFTPKEAELYAMHTKYGFEILRSKRELNLLSAHIAFQHHEWLNGNGYPRKLKGDKIHQWAQIVGICDFYDNLVNDGPGHKRISPYEACEMLLGSSSQFFPQDLVIAFLKHIAAFPTGCTVKLNTGEVGIVVDQNKQLPMRPIVRVLHGGDDIRGVKAQEYNLVEQRTVFIEKMIE